jgi:hypothetical protein
VTGRRSGGSRSRGPGSEDPGAGGHRGRRRSPVEDELGRRGWRDPRLEEWRGRRVTGSERGGTVGGGAEVAGRRGRRGRRRSAFKMKCFSFHSCNSLSQVSVLLFEIQFWANNYDSFVFTFRLLKLLLQHLAQTLSLLKALSHIYFFLRTSSVRDLIGNGLSAER